ncbi:hypothetical protein MED121_12620 [Marinomonas sp. MED121]|nr:hypothetical protein MED121_12620 [Marinomonas sp. MED121]
MTTLLCRILSSKKVLFVKISLNLNMVNTRTSIKLNTKTFNMFPKICKLLYEFFFSQL